MSRTAVLSKEQIIQAAFEITDTLGFEYVTIRAIANRLGTSTAPIYTQYDNIEAIYADLSAYVNEKLIEGTKVRRTSDSFLDIGVGMLSFALEHKLVFTNFYLSTDRPPFDFRRYENEFVAQMKRNSFLGLLEDERLRSILCDMWVFTYGIATMICTGIETSPELMYYQNMLEQTGNRIITYHILSSGKFEMYIHKIFESCQEINDVKEVLPHENPNGQRHPR